MAVAFLVGIIGLLNFINIYTVIMSKRSKEFGIKKVFGAGRAEIFLQIYAENILLTSTVSVIVLLGLPLLTTIYPFLKYMHT
ncbi:ABC transporter permease [Bacteroides sp. AF39-11AC]|uniref:ABC transporter permease n=1 Tax=Bacteroides TaxID=816 RepID=UPI003518C10A